MGPVACAFTVKVWDSQLLVSNISVMLLFTSAHQVMVCEPAVAVQGADVRGREVTPGPNAAKLVALNWPVAVLRQLALSIHHLATEPAAAEAVPVLLTVLVKVRVLPSTSVPPFMVMLFAKRSGFELPDATVNTFWWQLSVSFVSAITLVTSAHQ